MRAHHQLRDPVRLEWGPTGARTLVAAAVAAGAEVCAVVVDVLSFTTCVSVAADVGIEVLPWAGGTDGAAALALERGATLAVRRAESTGSPASRSGGSGSASGSGVSLSPASIRAADGVHSLVLPSPNGSTTSALLADEGARVVAACLRNRGSVAADVVRWLADADADPHADPATAGPDGLTSTAHERPTPRVVVLVPAGERWPDGSLRPALEDLWGAGAIAAALRDRLPRGSRTTLSPEAAHAAVAWDGVDARLAVGEQLADVLARVSSGHELVDRGWSDDVTIAAELDTTDLVPVLEDGVYRAT